MLPNSCVSSVIVVWCQLISVRSGEQLMIPFLCHELVYSATCRQTERERDSIGYRETVRPTAAWKCEWNFPFTCRIKRPSSGKIQFAARAKRRLMRGRCVVCKTERMALSLLCRLCSVFKGGRLVCATSGCHPLASSLGKKETCINDISQLIPRTNSTYWQTGVSALSHAYTIQCA